MRTNRKTIRALLLSFVAILMVFTSCDYGYSGRDGKAFLAITWQTQAPDYIDVGTPDIPPVFEYGRYYRAYPGLYKLYYEGDHWNGYHWAHYAWFVDYEVFITPGEPGGPNHYNGRDGADNYFTIECSPFGPYNFMNKSMEADNSGPWKIELETEEKIVMVQTESDFGIRVTYTKAEEKIKK